MPDNEQSRQKEVHHFHDKGYILLMNVAIDTIAKATGLTTAELEELKKQLPAH